MQGKISGGIQFMLELFWLFIIVIIVYCYSMIAHAPRLFDQFVYKANNLLPFPISVHVF